MRNKMTVTKMEVSHNQ